MDNHVGENLWPPNDDGLQTYHRLIERDQRRAWLAALEQEVEYGEAK